MSVSFCRLHRMRDIRRDGTDGRFRVDVATEIDAGRLKVSREVR